MALTPDLAAQFPSPGPLNTGNVNAGGGGGIGNLLQNKLFLQYLSAGGAALNPDMASIDKITQQNIAGQSQLGLTKKILAKMLASGGDFKVNKDKTSINVPTTALSEMGIGDAFGLGEPEKATNVNPSPSSLDISGADLAGLTPENIMQALSGAVSVENLKAQRVKDVISSQYTQQLTTESRARTGQIVSPRTKDERTTAQKNYDFAKSELGGNFKGSFTEFQDSSKTTHMKDYKRATSGGYEGTFNDWLLEMRKAGAIRVSIGEKVAEKKAKAEIENQLYFKSVDWIDDIQKNFNSIETQNKILMGMEDDPNIGTKILINDIESRITSGTSGGEIIDVKLSGRIMTWTVKWPSGDVEEIRYAVRD